MEVADDDERGDTLASSEAHRSIGEVLTLLKSEFPDITISKIRFLESQGLLDPERTPSGYRKFYDTDIERLRWILLQQRENFLPLKVIKGRLEDGTADVAAGEVEAPVVEGSALPTPSIFKRNDGDDVAGRLGAGASSITMTAEELAGASGLNLEQLAELEQFGLVQGRTIGDTRVYDDDALVVSRLSAGFMAHGVEPRHLRMYKVAAEKEASIFEQLVLPLLQRRTPRARRQGADLLAELSGLGDGLRSAMLRQSLREYED